MHKTLLGFAAACLLTVAVLPAFAQTTESLRLEDARAEAVVDFGDAQRLYEQANVLYADEKFAAALDIYERLYRAGYGTREVLFNAGNAAYRAGDTGRAVLYYRRALALDPSYDRARVNLQLIQPETNFVPDEGIGTLIERSLRATAPLPWLLLVEAGLLWLAACIVIVSRSEPGTEKRAAWIGRTGGAALLFAVFAGLFAFHGAVQNVEGDAVVVTESAITRAGPGENFFEQLELPAGTVFTIRGEPQRGWVEFKLLDGRTGFLRAEDVERI